MKSFALCLILAGASTGLAAPLPASATAEGLDITFTLQNILANTDQSGAYTYPTALTRGIVPVRLSRIRFQNPQLLLSNLFR